MMNCTPAKIRLEKTSDNPEIENIHSVTFGPGRFTRTAYRIREGYSAITPLCFVVENQNKIIGSIRYYAIEIGISPSLLLGPLAILPEYANQGYGKNLMEYSIDRAKKAQHSVILLVGDLDYYQRFGFSACSDERVQMPGPVDSNRLLLLSLDKKKTETLSGLVRGIEYFS